jgi:L-malate glycosyltransferase
VIFTEHGRHYPDIVSRKRRFANRLVLSRLADEITAVSRFSARSLADIDGFGGRAIQTIDNGIEAARYLESRDRHALRRRLGLDPRRRYVISVARFHPVKDHATLIRAFEQVAAARPDVDLLLAGDGPLRADLERQVAEAGICSRVRFLGVRNDVADLLRAADLFVLTSRSEAASITLLEAMASSLPLVVTAVGGNPEIVRDGVEGVLVPRGDAAAAARALGRLLDDPCAAREMGMAGRARVIERFTLEATVNQYHHRYVAAAQQLRG